MQDDMLRWIETGVPSALLKSTALARDLVKAGLRPDLLPSLEGRELARLILRVRDAAGDVTGAVEEQIAEATNLGPEGARLLGAVRDAPCPQREQALAYLALFELTELTDRCRSAPAGAAEARPQLSSEWQAQPPGAALHSLRRVHLPDPAKPSPAAPVNPQDVEAD